jgi:hypothetical protein
MNQNILAASPQVMPNPAAINASRSFLRGMGQIERSVIDVKKTVNGINITPIICVSPVMADQKKGLA